MSEEKIDEKGIGLKEEELNNKIEEFIEEEDGLLGGEYQEKIINFDAGIQKMILVDVEAKYSTNTDVKDEEHKDTYYNNIRREGKYPILSFVFKSAYKDPKMKERTYIHTEFPISSRISEGKIFKEVVTDKNRLFIHNVTELNKRLRDIFDAFEIKVEDNFILGGRKVGERWVSTGGNKNLLVSEKEDEIIEPKDYKNYPAKYNADLFYRFFKRVEEHFKTMNNGKEVFKLVNKEGEYISENPKSPIFYKAPFTIIYGKMFYQGRNAKHVSFPRFGAFLERVRLNSKNEIIPSTLKQNVNYEFEEIVKQEQRSQQTNTNSVTDLTDIADIEVDLDID